MQKKKENSYKHLDLHKLSDIYEMRAKGKSIRAIAHRVGCGSTAVCDALDELKGKQYGIALRNATPYQKAKIVLEWRQERRANIERTTKSKDPAVLKYIGEKLSIENWNPVEIAEKMKTDLGKSVCFKTIYNITKKQRKDLVPYLKERGKPRRQNVNGRRGNLKQGVDKKRSVHEREDAANLRLEFGHYEADLIVSKAGSRYAILVLRERLTRRQFYLRIPNHFAVTVFDVLRDFIESHPIGIIKSITFDNGPEFGIGELSELEKSYEALKLYYTDAYKSWQKGGVENGNKDFRWYFPKGTNFQVVTLTAIANADKLLSNRPREILNFRTPRELYQEQIEQYVEHQARLGVVVPLEQNQFYDCPLLSLAC